MIEYLPQALSSLGVALNVAKSIVGIRDTAKLQEALTIWRLGSDLCSCQLEKMKGM